MRKQNKTKKTGQIKGTGLDLDGTYPPLNIFDSVLCKISTQRILDNPQKAQIATLDFFYNKILH